MSTTKAVTLQLQPEDYARLAAEATRLGVQPAALAREYVEAALPDDAEAETAKRRRKGLAALERLDGLTAAMPEIDGVALAWESREALERRSSS